MKTLCLILLLSGCVSYNSYYYKLQSPENKDKNISITQKQDITFSVSNEMMNKDNVKIIREKLNETGIFGKVKHTFEKEKSPYHIHFDIKRGGTPMQTAQAVGTLSGATLMIIPAKVHDAIDTTMTIYVNEKEIYSLTAPVKQHTFFWLPLLPLSPTLFMAKNYREKNNMDYFINAILEEELYKIPQSKDK